VVSALLLPRIAIDSPTSVNTGDARAGTSTLAAEATVEAAPSAATLELCAAAGGRPVARAAPRPRPRPRPPPLPAANAGLLAAADCDWPEPAAAAAAGAAAKKMVPVLWARS
jgi:hypothetical protein